MLAMLYRTLPGSVRPNCARLLQWQAFVQPETTSCRKLGCIINSASDHSRWRIIAAHGIKSEAQFILRPLALLRP